HWEYSSVNRCAVGEIVMLIDINLRRADGTPIARRSVEAKVRLPYKLMPGLAGEKKWQDIGKSFAKATAKAFKEIAFWPELQVYAAPGRMPRTPALSVKAAAGSDVDKARYRSAPQAHDFAVVVGIEEYSILPAAKFAERDAEAVASHMSALGIPLRHIVHLSGSKASYISLKKYLESWLPRNVKPNSRVFFYFSGHGAPDVKTGEAYLVPWDGDPGFLKDTAYPLKRLYGSLGKLKAKEIIVALDACFSGAGGRSVL
ncbi:unnamed protein product, partial [marine sediment metagenome]